VNFVIDNIEPTELSRRAKTKYASGSCHLGVSNVEYSESKNKHRKKYTVESQYSDLTMSSMQSQRIEETTPAWKDIFLALIDAWKAYHPKGNDYHDVVYTHLRTGTLRQYIDSNTDLKQRFFSIFDVKNEKNSMAQILSRIPRTDIDALLVAMSKALYEEGTNEDLRVYIDMEKGHKYKPTLTQFRETVLHRSEVWSLYGSMYWPYHAHGKLYPED
jgi:hypothetical protein